jgi:hypothetical protein
MPWRSTSVGGVQTLLCSYPLVCNARTGTAGARADVRVNAFQRFTELKTPAALYVVIPDNVTLDCYSAFDVRTEPAVEHRVKQWHADAHTFPTAHDDGPK